MFLTQAVTIKDFSINEILECYIDFLEDYNEAKYNIILQEHEGILLEEEQKTGIWNKIKQFFGWLLGKIKDILLFIPKLMLKLWNKIRGIDKVVVKTKDTKDVEDAVKKANDILKTQEATKEKLNEVKENLKKAVDALDKDSFKEEIMDANKAKSVLDQEENKAKQRAKELESAANTAKSQADKQSGSPDDSASKVSLSTEVLKAETKIINSIKVEPSEESPSNNDKKKQIVKNRKLTKNEISRIHDTMVSDIGKDKINDNTELKDLSSSHLYLITKANSVE